MGMDMETLQLLESGPVSGSQASEEEGSAQVPEQSTDMSPSNTKAHSLGLTSPKH